MALQNATKNQRQEVMGRLAMLFRGSGDWILLLGDMGFAAVDSLREEFPDRVLNVGIAEQAQVGIAAGMAMAGWRPVVYGISAILPFRAAEQIRQNVVLQGLDVKFLGVGAHDYFAHLGASHACGDRDADLMALLGVRVCDPFTLEWPKAVSEWLAPGASYLRIL